VSGAFTLRPEDAAAVIHGAGDDYRYVLLLPPPRSVAMSTLITVVSVLALWILVGVGFWASTVMLGIRFATCEASSVALTAFRAGETR